MSSPADGTTFAYDANGNLLSPTNAGGAVKYTYDGLNRLVRVENAGQAIDYLNDVDGCMLQRTFTDVNGNTSVERFQYANRSMLAILGQNGHVKTFFTCDDEGRLLRRRSRAKLHPAPSKDPHSLFYLQDAFRSVVCLVDWDGNDFLRVDYDAWGGGSATGKLAGTERFRYRSGFQDTETGLVNFGMRWYDPTLGRWSSQDPLLVRLIAARDDLTSSYADLENLYTYVRNNPVGFHDPSGQSPEDMHLRERAQLQLIWEAFNVLNRANITAVQTTEFAPEVSPVVCGIAGVPCLVPQNAANVGLSAFGTATASAGPRVMQLAVRVVF